jgi:hypothetical protein
MMELSLGSRRLLSVVSCLPIWEMRSSKLTRQDRSKGSGRFGGGVAW